MSSSKKLYGICKLTKKRGVFGKSHIIPKTFTRQSKSGNYFLQGDGSGVLKKRWDSWYDPQLVIAEGEKILSDYDDFAAKELRRLNLVWSADSTEGFDGVFIHNSELSVGGKKVICHDPKKLRLFFLSLLWRAASTSLVEFKNVVLDENNIEKIRKMLIDSNAEPLSFFPITLLQITNKGHIHNFTPLIIENIIDIGNGKFLNYNVFRFYFDGLIINIHRQMNSIIGREPFIVGANRELIVMQQMYEHSFQYDNLKKSVCLSAMCRNLRKSDVSDLDKLRNPQKPIYVSVKIGRNEPCSCGSGIKYKKCCFNNYG